MNTVVSEAYTGRLRWKQLNEVDLVLQQEVKITETIGKSGGYAANYKTEWRDVPHEN